MRKGWRSLPGDSPLQKGRRPANVHVWFGFVVPMATSPKMPRWAAYVDVEGFGRVFAEDEYAALVLRLGAIASGLFTLATQVYGRNPDDESDCLFIHQLGDGFLTVSKFGEETLKRPVAIACGMMQSVLLRGGVCRAGISEGTFGSYRWLPQQVEAQRDGHHVNAEPGIMTVQEVMGTALIKAVKTQENPIKGPWLFVDPCLIDKVRFGGLRFCMRSDAALAVDWIQSDFPELRHVREALGVTASPNDLRDLLSGYTEDAANSGLSPEWIANARRLGPA